MGKLSEEIKGLPTVSQFKSKFLFIRPTNRSVFGISNIHGIKLLIKLRVECSDLRSHSFEQNFNCEDTSCLLEDESNPHYLLRCPHYLHLRQLYDLIFLCFLMIIPLMFFFSVVMSTTMPLVS